MATSLTFWTCFEVDVEWGTKRDRVSAAIKQVSHQDLVPFVDDLLELFRRDRVFELSKDWAGDDNTRDGLAESLASYGVTLLQDGRIKKGPGSLVDVPTLPDTAAVREHAERLRLAIAEGDSALLLGSSKELLESTAKIVLTHVGVTPPAKYPALVSEALAGSDVAPKERAHTA